MAVTQAVSDPGGRRSRATPPASAPEADLPSITDFAVTLRPAGGARARARAVPVSGPDARAAVAALLASLGLTATAVLSVTQRPRCDYCTRPAPRWVRDSGEGTPICMACGADHYGNRTRAHDATNTLLPNRFIDTPAEDWMRLVTTVECLTCGWAPDPDSGRGMVVHGENMPGNPHRELGHTDTAHKPVWVVDAADWVLVDVADLRPDDELPTGEIVQAVIGADEDEGPTSDTDDGQLSIITSQRGPLNVGWPGHGGSRIVRRRRAGEED